MHFFKTQIVRNDDQWLFYIFFGGDYYPIHGAGILMLTFLGGILMV